MTLDDTLWVHALRVNRLHEEHIRPHQHLLTGEERGLMQLIRVGIYDVDEINKPMDASTRAMRYSAILADHLSLLLMIEKTRVSQR